MKVKLAETGYSIIYVEDTTNITSKHIIINDNN